MFDLTTDLATLGERDGFTVGYRTEEPLAEGLLAFRNKGLMLSTKKFQENSDAFCGYKFRFMD
jgi:hypothetical protein